MPGRSPAMHQIPFSQIRAHAVVPLLTSHAAPSNGVRAPLALPWPPPMRRRRQTTVCVSSTNPACRPRTRQLAFSNLPGWATRSCPADLGGPPRLARTITALPDLASADKYELRSGALRLHAPEAAGWTSCEITPGTQCRRSSANAQLSGVQPRLPHARRLSAVATLARLGDGPGATQSQSRLILHNCDDVCATC